MSETAPPTHPAIPLHRLRVYNPSRMTDQEITLLFAVREDLLQRILADLSGEAPDSHPQHHLLVGQRGMGKTTLLLRIAAALRSPPLQDRFIPLSFAEEQYNIDRLSQFWLNCLDSLADTCDREGHRDQAQKIDRLVSAITASQPSSPKDDTAAARTALKTFLDAAALTGRRPVLLVDNLQLIFERSSDQQHDLRVALTEPNAPVLIAAAPQLPPAISDYSFPLYDHFKIHQLRALSLDDMRKLLLQLADRTNKPAIRRHVLDHPGRLQALHQLTGGNPRTTVLLFHLYAEDCSPSVTEDLEKLLDDVTSLYKARFEELSHQQQVIISRLAEHWDPADSRTLTENTRLEPGQISSQLDRLVKAGVVEEVPLFGTKRTGYQLAERFFNIWFLMRHASRRLKQPVRFLTQFLETLYEPGERERFARSHSNSSEHLCHPDSIDDWERTLATAADAATMQLAVDSLPQQLSARLNPITLQRASAVLMQSTPHTSDGWYNLGCRLTTKLHQHHAAQTAFSKGLESHPRNPQLWIGLGNLLQYSLADHAAAERAYKRALELHAEDARTFLDTGTRSQADPNLVEETEWTCQTSRSPASKHAPLWQNLGNLYQDHLGLYGDAADAFAKAAAFPESRPMALHNLAFLQRDYLGDIAAARQTFAAIENDSSLELADTHALHRALFAAHELNLGTAASHLDAALDLVPSGLPPFTIDDWVHTAAVLLELGHGEWFQQVLIRREHQHSLRPFFEAIRAHSIGDRAALLNIAVEVRPAAGWLFDQIQQRRERLQDARRQRIGPEPESRSARRRRKK